MASSFTAQDASKDGERGGGRNDEENECRGIRRRGRRGEEGGGFGTLARAPLNYPTSLPTCDNPNE